MSGDVATYAARCDCGNIEIVFETEKSPDELGVRACACSFCTARAARSISDPDGRVSIVVHDPARLSRYRFALKTADFLVCRECGAYVGAVFSDDGGSYAIVNVNYLQPPHGFTQRPTRPDYDAETAAERRARRKARWTPVVSFAEGAA